MKRKTKTGSANPPCWQSSNCPFFATNGGDLDLAGLSRREREVFNGLSEGECSKTIGKSLRISQHTVDTYKKRIYRKLGFGNQTELVKFLLRQNHQPVAGPCNDWRDMTQSYTSGILFK